MSNSISDMSNFQKIISFDLNLLIVFEAIFGNNSVSIAVTKLDTSPSSISQSLNRLRVYFSDPLFVRKGQGLVPTTIAINLHEKINKELGGLANTLVNFSETDITSKFIIYCSPYTAQRILPQLCNTLVKENLPYELVHLSADALLNDGHDILTYRKADLVFDTQSFYGNSTVTTLYMQEKVVAVCSKSHPRLGGSLNNKNIAGEKFVRVNMKTHGVQKIQGTIEENFRDRDFTFTSSCIDVNASIVEQTDFISFVSEWFYEKFGNSYNLKKLDLDFDFESIGYYMTYNKSSMNNALFSKFISVVKKTIGDSLEVTPLPPQ